MHCLFKKTVFRYGPFFKDFFEFVTILLLFYVLGFFWPQDMQDLSFLTRDWTHSPCIGRWSLNHRIIREFPVLLFFVFFFIIKVNLASLMTWEGHFFVNFWNRLEFELYNYWVFWRLSSNNAVILMLCCMGIFGIIFNGKGFLLMFVFLFSKFKKGKLNSREFFGSPVDWAT